MTLFPMRHLVMSEEKFGYDKGRRAFNGLRLGMLLKNPTVTGQQPHLHPSKEFPAPNFSSVHMRQMTPPLLRVTLLLAIHPALPLRASSSAIPFIFLFTFNSLITCYVEARDKSKINRIYCLNYNYSGIV